MFPTRRTAYPTLALTGLLMIASVGLAHAVGPWQVIASTPTMRPRATVLDTLRHRLVAVGTDSSKTAVWSFSFTDSAWSPVTTTGALPADGSSFPIAYDGTRDRILALHWNGTYSETWELPLATLNWSVIATANNASGPAGSSIVALLVDPASDALLAVFNNVTLATLNLSGTPAWSRPSVSGSPHSSQSASWVLDTDGDQLVKFGGCVISSRGCTGSNRVSVLTLSGAMQWSTLNPAGEQPALRYYATAIYDPPRRRLVIFSGTGGASDTWALPLTGTPSWSPLGVNEHPAARSGAGGLYDPASDRMLVIDTEVWAFDLAAPQWTRLYPTAQDPPKTRTSYSAIVDEHRDRMISFGGVPYDSVGPSNVAWSLSLMDPSRWSQLAATGPAPALYGHAAVYDSRRRRMLVFGGYGSGYHSETWALSLDNPPVWSQLATVGTPPPARAFCVAVLDTVHDRMVISLGEIGGGYTNDVWALSLSGTPTWTQLAPTGTSPPPMSVATGVYDGHRLVVFGGYAACCAPYNKNDVWTLELAGAPNWIHLAPLGTLPSTRAGHTSIYDPFANQMVTIEGQLSTGNPDPAVWALSLGGAPAWSDITPPGSPAISLKQPAVFDRIRGRLVVWAGSKTWALPLSTPVGVPISDRNTHSSIQLSVAPNPAHAGADIQLRMPVAQVIDLDAFDVSGRRIAAIFHGQREAGDQIVRWNPGRGLSAGVYLVRLRAGLESRTTRLLWLP